MTTKPRTIDNLGIDASIRYAKDQEFFEAKLIEESRLIPLKTEVSVARPFVLPEFEERFSLGKTIAWALFSPPPNYNYDKGLFSYQLIPSLGDYEKLEDDADKLDRLATVLEKPEDDEEEPEDDEEEPEDDEEEPEDNEREKEEKDRKTLIAFFQCLDKLNKALNLINSRRNQYQRG